MSTLEQDSYAFAVGDPRLGRMVRAVERMVLSLPKVGEAEIGAALAVIYGWRRAAIERLTAAGLDADEAILVVHANTPDSLHKYATEGRS